MPLRLPVSFEAEYRGQAPASEFTRPDTGEKVDLAPNLRFEVDLPDGDVELMAIRQGRLDEAADFDVDGLKRGERVHMEGMAVIADRGSDRESYFRPVAVRRLDAVKATPLRAQA